MKGFVFLLFVLLTHCSTVSAAFLNISSGHDQHVFFPRDATAGQEFGRSLAKSHDLLLFGSCWRAWVYQHEGNDDLSVIQGIPPIVGFGAQIEANEQFLAVSALVDEPSSYSSGGKVLIYPMKAILDFTNATTVPPPPLKPVTLQSPAATSVLGEQFGSSLSLLEDFIAVGSPGSYYGSVYVFKASPPIK